MAEKKKDENKSEKEVKKKPVENPEVAKLKEELEKSKVEAADFKDKWMRNVAEFDNYKKRNAKVWQDAFSDGVSSVVLKVLDIGDSLEWALKLGLDEKTAEGIKNLKKKFDDTLSSLEIEEIDPTGKPFDPNVAEAVMQAEAGEGESPDTVKAVLQKGYKYKDKIIRYAKVSVIK